MKRGSMRVWLAALSAAGIVLAAALAWPLARGAAGVAGGVVMAVAHVALLVAYVSLLVVLVIAAVVTVLVGFRHPLLRRRGRPVDEKYTTATRIGDPGAPPAPPEENPQGRLQPPLPEVAPGDVSRAFALPPAPPEEKNAPEAAARRRAAEIDFELERIKRRLDSQQQ